MLEEMLQELEELLKEWRKLPAGCIIYHHRGIYTYAGQQYINKEGGRIEKYIRKKDIPRMEKLFARKKYVKKRIAQLKKMLRPFRKQIREIKRRKEHKIIALRKVSTMRYSNSYRNYTLRGEYVISKSEALLADYLYFHKIKYEYSLELKLGENFICKPDFTLYVNGCVIYVEHLGKLDDPKYVREWKIKEEKYAEFGIFEGFNLICTRERNGAIDMQEIDNIFKSWGIVKW